MGRRTRSSAHNRIVGLQDVPDDRARQRRHDLERAGRQVVEATTSAIGRDGIFVITSRRNRVPAATASATCASPSITCTPTTARSAGNVSVGNHVGYAIMYSERLKFAATCPTATATMACCSTTPTARGSSGNVVAGPTAARGRGPPACATTEPTRTAAVPRRSAAARRRRAPGTEKCVFIYNANKNRFRGNWFEGCEIGIHFTAGSERNQITGNAFVSNRTQVKYVGTRYLDWSNDGRGNYWSDNPAFDLNGDGIADEAYRPERPDRPGALDLLRRPSCC